MHQPVFGASLRATGSIQGRETNAIRTSSAANVSSRRSLGPGLNGFLPHGIGHLLGLEVHDVGGFMRSPAGGEIERPAGHPYLRLTRTLQAGFVVTMEPGIYFIGQLLAAARKGEAFNLATGKPVSWQRDEPATSWYEFACGYVDMKWPTASAKYRRVIAQALAAANPALLPRPALFDVTIADSTIDRRIERIPLEELELAPNARREISQEGIERLAAMTNTDNYECMQRFERQMRILGVMSTLAAAGVGLTFWFFFDTMGDAAQLT